MTKAKQFVELYRIKQGWVNSVKALYNEMTQEERALAQQLLMKK